MKKKKRNFITKLFSLLLLGIISITLLGSWTYDPQNDTITSDNLYDPEQNILNGYYYSQNGEFVSVSNQYCTENYINVISNTYYYLSYGYFRYYDNNNNYLGYDSDQDNDITKIVLIPNNVTKVKINFGGINPNSTNIMLANKNEILPFEPYNQTYVNQQRLDTLELEYDDLAEQYSNLYDEKEQIQNDYNTLQNSYNAVESAYNQLESDFNTLESNYNDLSSRFSTLTDEYDTLLEEKQELQTEYQQLLIQYNLINQNLNQSNTYKYFYNAEVYYFNDVTHTYNYYVNNILNANASGTIQNITQNSNRVRYMDLPTSIQNYITTQADTPNGTHGYILIKLNVPTKLGINVEYQYLASNFKTALYNNFWDSELIYDFGDNPTSTIASLIIDNNNLTLQEEYQYLFIENIANRGGDIAFSNIYADEYLQAYANGYNTAIQDIDTITYNYKEQIKDLNTRIVHLNQQINTLQEQVNHPLDLNMRNLIWYIAETPFTSFKTIWNVDFLGLNIASFVTGLFSIWIVIFIIRKIFK